MVDNWVFETQADICKTMAQPKRLMLIHELRKGEASVGHLSAQLGISQPNISQHLAIMRKRGIVKTRREGATVYYSLASPVIGEACDLIHSFLLEQMAEQETLASSLHATSENSGK